MACCPLSQSHCHTSLAWVSATPLVPAGCRLVLAVLSFHLKRANDITNVTAEDLAH